MEKKARRATFGETQELHYGMCNADSSCAICYVAHRDASVKDVPVPDGLTAHYGEDKNVYSVTDATGKQWWPKKGSDHEQAQ